MENWYEELGKKMKSLDGTPCDKTKHCLKQVNPHAEEPKKREVFFGTPFLCEERAGACWQCVGHTGEAEAETKAEEKMYRCEECDEVLEGKQNLLDHYLVKHSIRLMDIGTSLDYMET